MKKGNKDLAALYPPYDKVTRGDVIAGRLKSAKGKKKMQEGWTVYHQLGLYLSEALGLSIEEADNMEGIRAAAERAKARKNPQSVIKEKPASKDPGAKSAKQDAAIKKAMGPVKVGYKSKRTGEEGVAGLAADIKYAGGAAKREELPDQPSTKSVEKGTYRGK